MQPLYIALVLFIVLWGLFFNLMSSYASRMGACRGRSGRFFWTLGTSLAITVAIFLLSEVLPRLYGGIMNPASILMSYGYITPASPRQVNRPVRKSCATFSSCRRPRSRLSSGCMPWERPLNSAATTNPMLLVTP